LSILVLPLSIDGSYLQRGDGTSQITTTINAPEIEYAKNAAHALVKGKLHIFGGNSDDFKVLFCGVVGSNNSGSRLSREIPTESGKSRLSRCKSGKPRLSRDFKIYFVENFSKNAGQDQMLSDCHG
jgi:hypothetical protein